MRTASVSLLKWPQQCNDLQEERHRSRALAGDRLAFNAYSDMLLKRQGKALRLNDPVRIAASAFVKVLALQ
jgi:hypothetical protein